MPAAAFPGGLQDSQESQPVDFTGQNGFVRAKFVLAPKPAPMQNRAQLCPITTYSLLRNVHQIVIRVAVDQLVIGIDACPRGRLVDDNLEGLAGLREPFLLQIERFLFVLLAGEDADVDQVMQRHGGFVAAAVGLEFAGLDVERDFVFVVRRGRDRGRDGLVVVEDDVLESVGDEVLQVRRAFGRAGLR